MRGGDNIGSGDRSAWAKESERKRGSGDVWAQIA